MRTPDINFRNIRKHRSSQNDGFEELTRQLVLAEPPANYAAIESRGPGADGGVELLVRFQDGRLWGWQSKYFPDSFGASEVAQLKKSFKAALENFPRLERYYVAVPRNFSGHAEGSQDTQTKNWNRFTKWCAVESAKLGRSVSIELWDETYFVNKLQRHDAIYAGMRLYWFDNEALDVAWFKQRLAKSFAYIGKRYRPDDHVEVGIADTIRVLRRETSSERRFREVTRKVAGAISVLQSLIRATGDVGTLKQDCSCLLERLESLDEAFADCEYGDLYARQLASTLRTLKATRRDVPSYQAVIDAQWERIEKVDQDTGKQISIHLHSSEVRSKISEVIGKIEGAASEFSPPEIDLLEYPFLLVAGDAGVGKSHLLANQVETHIKNDNPALFVPARVLDHGDRPEQDLLRYLDVGDLRFETFLAALHAAALASGSSAILVIDGLNESLFARGWESGLPSLITQIDKFNRIALCVSIRSSYRELCIRPELHIAQISHHGFRGHLGEAAKEYLDRNGIERPSAPIFGLNEILYNPLFLSTAVDFMKATGQVSFPRGMDSIATLISFWLGAVEQNLITKGFDRISLNDGKIPQIMRRLSSEMAATGSEYVAFELVHNVCEETVDLAPPAKQSDRLLPRLIDEGLLLDFPSDDSETGKRVSFGFQKFSDYFIADAIIRECRTPQVLAKELKSGGKYAYLFSADRYHEFAGPRIALLALTPARLGQELPLIEEGLLEGIQVSVEEFTSSLLWRRSQDISEQTVELLERQRRRKGKNGPLIDDSDWFGLLLELAPLSNCLLNASYLKKDLASLPLGERDARWSVYLVGKTETYDDDWSSVQQLIDWAWVAPKSEIEAEKIHQVAIALALMTSTMDRQLRDCATKALASLLIKFPSEISTLIDEFADWNDSYVRERVLAAAAAGVLYCDDSGALKAAALAADRMVFAKRPVERHAWTRRYAQIIVDQAIFNKVGIADELIARSTPPYSSEIISEWPTLEQIAPGRDNASSIFSSVVGFVGEHFDGKAPMMAGDFGRYTMGRIDSFSAVVRGHRLPLSRKDSIQDFWKRVAELGTKARDTSVELIRLTELRESLRFSDLIEFADRRDHALKDVTTDEEITEEAIEKLCSEAETSILALLPDKMREEYDRLQPLRDSSQDRIPTFSLLQGQCWVFDRTQRLGWQRLLHEEIERKRLRYSHDRYNHQVERIGKKYQHIAFGELVGYLADHHWYVDWEKDPSILLCLEEFKRADIDATYLSGAFSKPAETYLPGALRVPEMILVPDSPESNMAWTKTLDDIPDPVPFLSQSGDDGYQWYLQHSFCRSKDYMKGFESTDPFRSAQCGIELILVDQADVEKLQAVTTEKIDRDHHDVFENSWSSPSLLGQRSFRHSASAPAFSVPYRAADFRFARITERCSPNYSEFDRSGVSDEAEFYTPHPALLAELRLRPKDGWSTYFVTANGEPAFSDIPSFLAGVTVIRQDLIEKFARNHNLKVVWRVWVEKDGGLGTNHGAGRHRQVARNDFIGFFFKDGLNWRGKLISFRS
ncbi:hypothetical protein [Bradyrhizobium yuanmingense]|uniref:NACHT domain-containing protein n=1 Tax=Bradyrhizobium yuanmingense TaxID=108015 RepID=A0ABV4GGP1_9BRAD|nr:hypothetical protein [Bradyrhizobium yuanmingense]